MTRAGAIGIGDAERLNVLSREVSPVLFWTCNYEPSPIETISPDAEYLLRIQDLYKFTIDTNCVLRDIAVRPRKSICWNILRKDERLRLSEDVKLVETLRTYIDHNQSEQNGRTSSAVIDEYWLWVKKTLGKDECSDARSYERLNEELLRVGQSLVKWSECILSRIRTREDREAIASTWKDAIISWYCSTSRNNFYRGQLEDYYAARAVRDNVNFMSDTDSYALRTKVNRWISSWATDGLQAELNEMCHNRAALQRMIDDPHSWGNAANRLSPSATKTILQKMQDESTYLEHRIASVEEEMAAFDCKQDYAKAFYYFDPSRLFKQLEDTLTRLTEADEDFTLLPQDFLLHDIEYHFASIPSPDYDFI